MGSLLQFTTSVILVIGTCLLAGGSIRVVESFDFGYHFCSPIGLRPDSPLGKARENLLLDLGVKFFTPPHRYEHATCLKRTVQGYTMWALAECADPSSKLCVGCLMMAEYNLNKNCRWFSGGRVKETAGVCSMQFGDDDVCGFLG